MDACSTKTCQKTKSSCEPQPRTSATRLDVAETANPSNHRTATQNTGVLRLQMLGMRVVEGVHARMTMKEAVAYTRHHALALTTCKPRKNMPTIAA